MEDGIVLPPGSEQPAFKVRVVGVQFVAGHMATFAGSAEPLHGHNYEVAAEVEGTLTDDAWVVDFIELKAILRGLADQLDHRFMLQSQSRVLQIDSNETSWQIKTPAGASYVLPRSDVAALEIDNATAERLSEWFCERVWRALAERGVTNIRSLSIEVNEGPDQRASYRKEAGQARPS